MARKQTSEYLSSVTVGGEYTPPSAVDSEAEITNKEEGDIVPKGKPIKFICDCGAKHEIFIDEETHKLKHKVTPAEGTVNAKGKEVPAKSTTENSGTSLKDFFLGTGAFADDTENQTDENKSDDELEEDE